MVRPGLYVTLSASLLALAPIEAAAQQKSEIFFACLNAGNGSVRIIGATEECHSNESRVQWNVVGQTGPQGERGLQGDRGPQGATGLQGERGQQGATGVQGETGATGAAGATGATGSTGATGADGAVGPQGPSGTQGPSGSQGPSGAKGDTGEVGPTGPAGPQGAEGLQGPSGFANVFGFENSMATTSNSDPKIPGICQTAEYTAGANETAIVSVDITYFSTGASHMYMKPYYGTATGGALSPVNFYAIATVFANTFGSLHNQMTLPLTKDEKYRFFAGIKSDAMLTLSTFTCRGLVTIVKKP